MPYWSGLPESHGRRDAAKLATFRRKCRKCGQYSLGALCMVCGQGFRQLGGRSQRCGLCERWVYTSGPKADEEPPQMSYTGRRLAIFNGKPYHKDCYRVAVERAVK